ncbi:hypothetical protein [Methanomethylophilus alvi]|uniref:hypothetical protein n=1 Tax=Methanomethylophilus alvi TaxID=1291540 RepID=UPI0037DC3E1E
MNASENENSHKKKLIVPIIAIMLCAVAVIGVGYAYTSDVHVNGNTLNGGDLQIDYTANSEDAKTHAIFYSSDSSIDVTFVTDRTYNAGPDGSIADPTTTVKFGGSSSDGKSSYIGTMVVTITSSTLLELHPCRLRLMLLKILEAYMLDLRMFFPILWKV